MSEKMVQAGNIGSGKNRTQEQQGSPVRMHVLVHETNSDILELTSFPCYDCGHSVTPDPERTTILDIPVRHAVQFGACQHCRAKHIVLSAKTQAQCLALEPVVRAMDVDGRPRIAPQLLPRSID